MSEIKFACPHCGQHIACDSDYVSLGIECPSCGGSMIVPRLMSVGSQHPDTVIVASTPSPKRSPAPQVPTFGAWTKEEWRHHYDEVTGAAPEQSPPWLVAAFCTLIFAAVLRANNAGLWLIILCLLVGGIVSGILAAKSGGEGRSVSGTYQLLKVLTYVCAAIIILPVIALGILFLGCTVCR
jgi:DNA-directed RNA polymerase subunit RPC12/RpoP